MAFFSPAKSIYTNTYDQERYNLTWNVGIVITVVFATLATYNGIVQSGAFVPTFGGFLTMLICMIQMRVSRSYRFTAFTVAIASTIVSQTTIYLQLNASLMIDLIWIIATGIYIFYMLGLRAGSIFLIINFGALILSIFILDPEAHSDSYLKTGLFKQLDAAFNLAWASIVMIYLVYKLLKESRDAEAKSKAAQSELEEKSRIVEAQNEEKTVMLREIHHRVKNNLQVITSLLRLQSRDITDKETSEQFREAINRVMAMALIHNKLYQSEDLSKVDVKGYLEDLSNDLIESYAVDIPVDLSVETNVEFLVPKSLVSVGLLFNELISNSLKHGFKSTDHGMIRINIHAPNDDTIEMMYSDNGKWATPVKEDSFGLELIDTLTSQLVGKYERSIEEGTHYHFIFEIEK